MALDLKLGDLEYDEDTTTNKILESLINDKNIDLKTHIINPVVFATLNTIIYNIENLLTEMTTNKLKLPKTKKFLEDFIFTLKKFMISWNRLSRNEITTTLQSIRNEEQSTRSFAERLMGLGRK